MLEISFDDARWRRIPRLAARLEKAAAVTLACLPKSLQFPCTVNVLLTKDAVIRKLNRDFLGLDKPTNVLSFPQFAPRRFPKKSRSRKPIHIGDVAISYQYIVAEAKVDHKILINHVTHLLIHGILHLFSYDHVSDAEAARMERAEKQIMAKLGLPDPYTHHIT